MIADDCACSGCGTAHPHDVLFEQRVQPLESVSLDDEGEEVQDAVVVVWIGEDEFAFPEGV